MGTAFLRVVPYAPPPWAAHLSPVPPARVCLAQTPTPVQRWAVPGLPAGVELFLKRDDWTGSELSGNKVRAQSDLHKQRLRSRD